MFNSIELKKNRFYFVIPCAGTGSRTQLQVPKQYLDINGKPLLHYSLEQFRSLSFFTKGIIALNPLDQYWNDYATKFKIKTSTISDLTSIEKIHESSLVTVEGGDTRTESVFNACLALKKLDDQLNQSMPKPIRSWVLVHDAARPGISKKTITKLCQALVNDEVGGLLALPVADTVKKVVENRIESTLDRNEIYLAQTPQMFELDTLIQAIEYCHQHQILITDEASAIEQLGLKPKIILGDLDNFKVTYPEDIHRIKEIIRKNKR